MEKEVKFMLLMLLLLIDWLIDWRSKRASKIHNINYGPVQWLTRVQSKALISYFLRFLKNLSRLNQSLVLKLFIKNNSKL